jgi:OOP family OmpA-OmpF porin
MRFIFAFVATALLASAPAFAADDAGFYVGAGFGEAAVEVNDIVDSGLKFDDSGTTWKLVGGYKFMKYLAAELEYFDSSDAEDRWTGEFEGFSEELKVKIGLSGFNASAVGILPLGEKFNVFGKLGFVMWDADFEARYIERDPAGVVVFDEQEKGTDDGTDISWGIGAGFDFTENFGVRLEYQSFEIEDTDAALLSASVLWMF